MNKTQAKKYAQNSSLIPAAVLGGPPAFSEVLPITKPTIPPVARLTSQYERILKSGMITNAGYVKEFERQVAEYLGVKEAVAVSSCTLGLMLTLKVLKLKGEVILPSFTFHATGHAIVWNGMRPVFVDCLADTYNIDPAQVEKAVTAQTSAILGVHIFGNPADISALEKIAKKYRLKLIFDAAHGFGSQYQRKNVGGFGDAEVFSLSPTKLLTSGEGGMVATNDLDLAKQIRIGRNYGDSGDYDSLFSGFNSRMSEFHALLGIESLRDLEKNVAQRIRMAQLYKKLLTALPGISFQKIADGNRSSFKDFSILIDQKKFGLSRDQLSQALLAENIIVKKYFYPPVHEQKAFLSYQAGHAPQLPVTQMVANNILSLPLYSHIAESAVRKVCAALHCIYDQRGPIKTRIP